MSIEQTAEVEQSVLPPEQWVDQYGDFLFRYANSRLRNPAAAEEVVQETFLAGIRHVDQFAGRGSQRGWLLGILKRKIVDMVRSRARQERQTTYTDSSDPTVQLFDENGSWFSGAMRWSPQPDEKIQSRELWQIVANCLTTLPPGQADVFMLSVMEEMDSDAICRELNISPSNLWVRMHRARLGLAKCVGSKWFTENGTTSHAE